MPFRGSGFSPAADQKTAGQIEKETSARQMSNVDWSAEGGSIFIRHSSFIQAFQVKYQSINLWTLEPWTPDPFYFDMHGALFYSALFETGQIAITLQY